MGADGRQNSEQETLQRIARAKKIIDLNPQFTTNPGTSWEQDGHASMMHDRAKEISLAFGDLIRLCEAEGIAAEPLFRQELEATGREYVSCPGGGDLPVYTAEELTAMVRDK